ncbi:DUF1996 domain-containing protein [Streptacidiphilus sp. ASG 303]|uniref:DUF1996 domain-containing protein n=1 Tax=Streptacidiphilus sp. ASG 303 TaxID=2896847 RepID=UPI001E481CBD|nr:DUF1996 domain-containing protein [Streptacidiphilus sp. ASG 303]MCD0484775.1 DUF1996 domain-containing protein [Streptacidiphilus sp. ASG 303]
MEIGIMSGKRTRGPAFAALAGLAAIAALCLGVLRPGPTGPAHAGPVPAPGWSVDIREVAPMADPPPAPGASTGSWTEDCGRNEEHHRNTDNVVLSPGVSMGAHHTHDYVGNLSTDAFSTDDSLAAAGTTCTDGDRSTFFWPVLRVPGGEGGGDAHGTAGTDGNTGTVLDPASVSIGFSGSPTGQVVPMPRFLRLVTGDAKAATDGGAHARAEWGCEGFPGRLSLRYTRCPVGHRLTTTLDFPDCWDGLRTDSADHRSHAVFPLPGGSCPQGTFPVPHLRVVVAYAVPPGTPVALDSFPEQRHDPSTGHALFIDVMSDSRMAEVVACINEGRHCRD